MPLDEPLLTYHQRNLSGWQNTFLQQEEVLEHRYQHKLIILNLYGILYIKMPQKRFYYH